MKRRKIVFGIYFVVVAVLSIGWRPSPQSGKAEKRADVYRQEVLESAETERMTVTLKDELVRRKVKTVVRYRISIDAKSRNVLERIVEAEAGNQTIAGRQMVANVIINRVRSPRFPNSVEKVVFAHRQFSPVSNGSYHRAKVSKKTKEAVEKALTEKDNTQGALYFMYRAGSDSGNVSWFDRALTRLYKYGCHEFFK